MTKEEAILILEEEAEFLYGDFLYGDAPYNKTAFDMAIEALSAEVQAKCIAEIKVDAEDIYTRITGLVADKVDVVRCKDCRHLDVWNLKNIYAVCSKHGITFEPFEDDTRTCFCSWGERSK